MKLPNGFGSVYKLPGRRRRPFVVKKTFAGKQKTIGYFASHDEALSLNVGGGYHRNIPRTIGCYRRRRYHSAQVISRHRLG